jgi:hypothetical protein
MLTVVSVVIPDLAQTGSTSITVRLFNRSGVAAPILNDGESQSGEILRRAGISVFWLNCGRGGTQECVEEPSSTNFIFTILKQGSAMGSDDALGLAVQDARGSGAYGYIFENRLDDISGQNHISTSRLLGYALAHEIGHLLKGTHSHSAIGIMSAYWSKYELEQISRGSLSFTQKDEKVMRSRLSRLEGLKQTATLDSRH